MRQVKEERFVAMSMNERDRLVGIPLDNRLLVVREHSLQHRFVSQQRKRRLTGSTFLAGSRFRQRSTQVAFHAIFCRAHVVGIRQSVVIVKTLLARQKLRLIPQVPLADDAGRVALFFEKFSDRDLTRIKPFCVTWKQDVGNAEGSLGIAAGHQRRSRWRADRSGVVARQLATFLGHAVEMRRPVDFGTKRFDIRVPEIINVDVDEVGLCLFGRPRERAGRYQHRQNDQASASGCRQMTPSDQDELLFGNCSELSHGRHLAAGVWSSVRSAMLDVWRFCRFQSDILESLWTFVAW